MKPIILCYLFIQETYYANVLHLAPPLLVFQYHSPRNTFITPLTDSSGMPFFLFQHLIFSNTFPAFHSNNQSTFLRSLRSQQTFFVSIQPEVTSCLHQALLFCPTIGFGSINSCLCLVLSFRYSQRYASTFCVSVFSLMHQMCLQIMPTCFMKPIFQQLSKMSCPAVNPIIRYTFPKCNFQFSRKFLLLKHLTI